jgi:hypothetical protein
VADPAALIAEAVERLSRRWDNAHVPFGGSGWPDFRYWLELELQAAAQVDVDGLCAYLIAHGASEHLCAVARTYFDQPRAAPPAGLGVSTADERIASAEAREEAQSDSMKADAEACARLPSRQPS